MSKVSGSGPSPTGMTQLQNALVDDAKSAQAEQALKDINKKTDSIQKDKKIESDAFQQTPEQVMPRGSPAQVAAAQAKLKELAMPGLQELIESTLKVRIDPEKALRIHNKLQSTPELKQQAGKMRDAVETWQREVLEQHAKNPPKVPDFADVKRALEAKSNAPVKDEAPGKQNAQQKQPSLETRAPETRGLETPASKANDSAKANEAQPASKANKPDSPKSADTKPASKEADETKKTAQDAQKTTQSKEADQTKKNTDGAAKDANKAAETKNSEASKLAADPKPTDETSKGAGAKPQDAKNDPAAAPPATEAPATNSAQAMRQLSIETEGTAKPVDDAAEAAKVADQAALDALYGPLPEGELDQVDPWGNLIVEPQFYSQATQDMAALGITPQFLQTYDYVASQVDQPLSTRLGSGEVGSGVSGGGMGGGVGGAGGSVGGGEIVKSTVNFAVLGDIDNMDFAELAFIVLTAAMKDLNLDLKLAQKNAKMRHLMNDAMRNYYAEFLQITSKLRGAKIENPEDIKKNRVEITYMEPQITTGPDGEEMVTMVPVPITMTFEPVHLEGDEDQKKEEYNMSAAEVAQQNVSDWSDAQANAPPPPGPVQLDNGKTGYVVRTSRSWITPTTVAPRAEAMKAKIESMRQDMEKEVLRIQKFMDLQKNVMQNLTKILKTTAEEQAKMIAALRR